MNSLHVNTEMTWRGGERQVLLLLHGLIDRGCSGGLCAHPASAIARKAIQEGLPFYPVKLKGPLDIPSAKKIAHAALKHGVDTIHLHTAHACALGPWVRRFFPPVKLVASRRVAFPIRSARKYKKMDAIIAVSNRIKEMLRDKGIGMDKICLIHDGVPVPDMPLSKEGELIKAFNLQDAFPIIGTVAHLSESKGHRHLLEAVKLLQNRLPKARYLMIGEGELRQALEEKARNLNILDQVVFAGFREDVNRFLPILDLFVMPSLTEGLCSSLLDAMAYGVPAVATETGGIPDVLRSGENGVLVPPADPSALAEAMHGLAVDEPRRRVLGEKGRVTIEKKFSIQSTVDQTIALYRDLLED